RRSRRQAGSIGLAVLAGLALTVLLTVCIVSTVLPVLSQLAGRFASNAPAGGTRAQSASPTPVASTRTGAPTDTSVPASDWYSFTSQGGFRLDIPSVLGSSHGYFINDASGQGTDLSYHGAPATSPLQQLATEISVSVLYSTKIVDRNICPQGGTRIRIGSGSAALPAWERDFVSSADLTPSVAVNLVLNGVAIAIDLNSPGPPHTFLP